jgi:hypothetical protein
MSLSMLLTVMVIWMLVAWTAWLTFVGFLRWLDMKRMTKPREYVVRNLGMTSTEGGDSVSDESESQLEEIARLRARQARERALRSHN